MVSKSTVLLLSNAVVHSFFILFISSNAFAKGIVKFSNVLYRHGARTPNRFYPKDPYQSESYWPEGIAQLTNKGKQQQYELGQWLRKRYDSLLTEEYSPDIVYVRSTDVDRTLMSAQCNLAGMFPPKGAQVWNEHIAWQPIPVHTIPEIEDKVLASGAPCPAYTREYQTLLESNYYNDLKQNHSYIFNVLHREAGGNGDDFEYVHDVYDDLFIEEAHGLHLPEFTQSIYPHPLYEAAVQKFLLPTRTTKLARLKSGLLLKEMIQNMNDKVENRTSRSMHIYSAHDLTIANLLNTLQVFDPHIPPFAACVTLDLWDWNELVVVLHYRNSSTSEHGTLLTIPGCEAFCPLAKFISLVQPVIPVDWDKECEP